MTTAKLPRRYPHWRERPIDRAEDAAYAFGYHLLTQCRDPAFAYAAAGKSEEVQSAVNNALDDCLGRLCGMLEGVLRLEAGPDHYLELALQVRVHTRQGEVIETQEIAPEKLDLPIGYWKWANDRAFQ